MEGDKVKAGDARKGTLPVAVIGAGAGGLPAAVALAEAGVSVVLIERGGEVSPTTYPTNRYDYEQSSSPWNATSDEWNGPVKIQRGTGLGGSTLYFQAVSHLPEESVLRAWGLPATVVRTLGREIIDYLKIAGEVQPAHPLNAVSSRLLETAAHLRWKARSAPVAILSRSHDGRPACNHCGLCVYGCRPGDKSSADRTWLPRLRRSKNHTILTNTRVDAIELESARRVKRLALSGPQGKYRLPVSALVLAAGALETPHLLKSSRQAYAPHGIGNRAVGRFLTGTLSHNLLIAVPQSSGGGQAGVPIDILVEEFVRQGILLCQSRNMAGILGPAAAAKYYARHPGNTDVRTWMRFYYPRLACLVGFAESSTGMEDGLLEPGKKTFHKAVRADDERITARMRRLLHDWGNSAAAELLSESRAAGNNMSGSMLRGTCRMGVDPETSAVTPDGRLRGYDNIVVSDASVLGRGLIADPSLSLQLLGLHFGRELSNRLHSA